MSYILGSTTLPDPQGLQRRYIEKSVYHDAINGRTTRDITGRKEQFILRYARLAQSVVASILSEYERRLALSFSASDGDLNINATDVHVEVQDRSYNTKGSEYREDFVIVLTEVE